MKISSQIFFHCIISGIRNYFIYSILSEFSLKIFQAIISLHKMPYQISLMHIAKNHFIDNLYNLFGLLINLEVVHIKVVREKVNRNYC